MTGAGSSGSPFTIGTTFDWSRLFQQTGIEPWVLTTVGGCTVLASSVIHEMV